MGIPHRLRSAPKAATRAIEEEEVALLELSRATRARLDADPAAALLAWRRAALVAPQLPELWIEFAELWRGIPGAESAEAFGLCEALVCARGEAPMVRAIEHYVRARTTADLASYFETMGHPTVGAWLRARE